MPRPVRRTRRRLAALAPAVALLLAGCASVDEDEVRAIGDLPGIDYALSSCDLAGCTVSVRAEVDATADELLAALTAGRDTGAERVAVTVEEGSSVSVVGEGAGQDDDAAAVDLVVGAPDVAGVDSLVVGLDADGTDVAVRADGAAPVWDVAEELWPDVEGMEAPSLTVTQSRQGDVRSSRVVADGELPTAGIALVRDVVASGPPGYVGAVVDGDSVLLGAIDVRSAGELEAYVADSPVRVEVVVTTNVLEVESGSAADDPDPDAPTEEDRRALLGALTTDYSVTVRVEQGVLLVNGTDLAAVADRVDAARAAEPDAASRVSITVGDTVDASARGLSATSDLPWTTVELRTDGSTDLVRLAALLRADPEVGDIDLSVPDPDREVEAPYDADAAVAAAVRAPDLATGVTRVAAIVGAWTGDASSLTVGVTAVDPEGRTPRAGLRVDREGGTWLAEGLPRQTEEEVATARAAWAAGVSG
ncbi:MAG TPA: hypothetical protein VGE77_07175 [Nocardioides sp.]